MATLPSIISLNIAPTLTAILIGDGDYNLFQGATANIGVNVRHSGVFGPQRLMDVGYPVVITLFDPLGNLVVDDAVMTRYDVGRYFYQYHTKYNDPIGLWTARFTTQHNNATARLDNVGIFLLKTSTFATFDVIVIIDPSGNTWYLYVSLSGEAIIASEAPTFVGRIPVVVATANALRIPDYIIPSTFYYLSVANFGELTMQTNAPIGAIATINQVVNVVGRPAKLYGNIVPELLVELL